MVATVPAPARTRGPTIHAIERDQGRAAAWRRDCCWCPKRSILVLPAIYGKATGAMNRAQRPWLVQATERGLDL